MDIIKSQSSQSLTYEQGALWRHQRDMLFTTELTYKQVFKIYLIVSDSDKGEDTVPVIVDFPYNPFDDPGAAHEIIWLGEPSSEFKNKFMVYIF